MCEDCDMAPVQYVAYFNKPGGTFWRPAQKAPTAWAIDIRPSETAAPVRAFVCDDAGASVALAQAPEEGAAQSSEREII